MSRRRVSRSILSASRAFGLALLLFAPAAFAQPGVVKVKPSAVVRRLIAYGQVVPIALARLRAAEPGVITGLTALPGQAVVAGTILGHLTGPEVAALLTSRRSAVAGAKTALQAAEQALTSERQNQAAHLATRPAVIQAEAEVEDAKVRLTTTTAALQAITSEVVLRAPASGAVVVVAAGDGERVGTGQTVLTVEPKNHIWLKAIYYGEAAGQIHLGMNGSFAPADGSASFAVKVVSILPVVGPDGGLSIGLRPSRNGTHMTAGEAGMVMLNGALRSGVMVPTRALILDRGVWWVLVHTPRGDIHQQVTLGPSRGDQTLIERGLKAGTKVVVTNAYLKFHRNVSRRYQPPD